MRRLGFWLAACCVTVALDAAALTGAYVTYGFRAVGDADGAFDPGAAAWSVDNGRTWNAAGERVALAGGSTYTIVFRAVAPWAPPPSVKLEVVNPKRHKIKGEWCEPCNKREDDVVWYDDPEELALTAFYLTPGTAVADCRGGRAAQALDPSAWKVGDRIAFLLDDETAVECVFRRHLPGIGGRSVFLADSGQGGLGARAAIVRSADGFRADVRNPASGRAWTVTAADGRPSVRELEQMDESAACGNAAEKDRVVASGPKLMTALKAAAQPQESLRNVVDVLIAYDEGAVKWLADNGAAAEDFAEVQVAKMNAVLEGSGLLDRFRYRLVGAVSVARSIASYAEVNSARFALALAELTNTTKKPAVAKQAWKDLLAVREELGADIVMVLAGTGTRSGVLGLSNPYAEKAGGPAWNSDAGIAAFADEAFSICEIGAVDSGYVLAHEAGHLLGAGHPTKDQVDPDQIDVGPQLFGYSSAYLFSYGDKRYTTVMGYTYDGKGGRGFTTVPAFSSPDLTLVVGGEDTGVKMGIAGKCDNALTLARTYTCAARFRPHVLPDPGFVDYELTVTASAGGKATGGGRYCPRETAALSATADRGFVFAGWYEIGADGATNRLETGKDWRVAAQTYVVGERDTELVAKFLPKDPAADPVTDLSLAFSGEIGRAGMSLDVSPAMTAESGSLPTFTAKKLPSGLKFDAAANRLYGTLSKPGTVTATFVAKNLSGATFTKAVEITVGNWRDDEVIPIAEAYGPFVPGVPVSIDLGGVADGCSVSGLPSGLKWTKAKALVSGTPTKPGSFTAVFSKSVKEGTKKVTHKSSATFTVGPYPVLSVVLTGTGTGKVTGVGAYAANRKVTLRATADAKNAAATSKKAATVKSAFAGWYWHAEDDAPFSQATSLPMVMPSEDTVVYARFVTAEEDAASIRLAVAGSELDERTEEVTNLCGVAVSWPVEASALSLPSVKVAGLPTGLKYDAKTGLVSGAPTSASKVNARTKEITPSTVKFTVKTGGKSSRTYQRRVYVMPLPDWAVGTFNGGGEGQATTLTLAKTGKVSGKLLEGANTWTLSAGSLASGVYDEEIGARDLRAEVLAKLKKETFTNEVCFLCGDVTGLAVGETFAGVRNVWKEADYKAFAKGFSRASSVELPAGDGELTFKFASSGAVTVRGAFGSWSGSASSCLEALTGPGEGFEGRVHVHFPPKASKRFDGYDGVFDFVWRGNGFAPLK